MSRFRMPDSRMQRDIEALPDSLEEAQDLRAEQRRYVEFHAERLRDEAELWPEDFHGHA